MIDPLSPPEKIKEQLGALVSWGSRLPDYVFTQKGYPYAYFFESSIIGRPDLLNCLVAVLRRTFNEPVILSVGHDGRNGQFSRNEAASTLLISEEESGDISLFEGCAFSKYIATHPYAGLTCGTNPSVDWMLFEDPTDLVGVLVARQRIDLNELEVDYVFDLKRFLQLAAAPQLDFSSQFIEDIGRTYGGGWRIVFHFVRWG